MRFKPIFCFIVIFLFISTFIISMPAAARDGVRAEKGIIDLSSWNFEKDGIVNLTGEWEFYYNHLLTPGDFKKGAQALRSGIFQIPGSWNYYLKGDNAFPGHGYATYRLIIKLKKGRAYALNIQPISTAYKLWVDDKFVTAGKVAETKKGMIPKSLTKIFRFVPEKNKCQLVLQVSNFYHRSGGPWLPIKLGLFQQILEQRIKSFAFDLFLMGSILMMGLYHFALFIQRRKEIATFYFGALCLAAVVRTSVTGANTFYLLFPEFSWFISYKLVYLSFYLAISLLVLFFNSLYPEESLPGASKISMVLAAAFSLVVIFTPPQIFSHTMRTYQIITLITLFYLAYIIIKAVLKKRKGALLVAAGSALGIAAIINDILIAKEMINSFFTAPLGLFFFMLFHSLNLSIKFSNAFSDIEIVEEKYRSIFENSLDGIVQVSFVNNSFIANPALGKMLGFSSSNEFDSFIAGGWDQVFLKKQVFRQYWEKLQLDRQVNEFEAQLHCRNKESKWVSINSRAKTDKDGAIITIDSIVHDITHRKEKEMLEAKMLQVQKMEAVGHLAGGIAHDFNNIISAILSNAQILKMDHDNSSKKDEKRFLNIIGACERATDLINQILTFSRKNREDALAPIKIDSVVKEVTDFISNTIPGTIKIEENIDAQSMRILSDSTQIYQILMNLYYNAMDAMEKNGGILRVSLSSIETEGKRTSTGYLPKGEYLELMVSDTGEGIPSEILSKIFDPYYTTKEQGKGTGLGLSLVHGIVKSHGGEIQVKSEQGKGTVFKIYIPLTHRKEEKKETYDKPIEISGRGRVLFVDDEEVIAEVFGELLATFGFEVDTHTTPREALQKVEKDLYDVIVTDYKMPVMNGIELAGKIRKRDKKVKIIICSGDVSAISSNEYIDLDLYSIMKKPVEYSELAQLIQKAVNSE